MSDKVMKIIQALLAKSTEAGATEAEAMAALAKANELMEKYGVSPEQVNKADAEKDLTQKGWKAKTKNQHPIAKYSLTTIAAFCEVRCYGIAGTSEVVFKGFDQDVEMASYMLEMLANTYDACWKQYLKETPFEKGMSRHRQFWGFGAGFSKRVNERMQELIDQRAPVSDGSGTALIVKKFDLIDASLEHLNLRSRKSTSTTIDLNARASGKKAGDSVNLGRPVDGSAGMRALR